MVAHRRGLQLPRAVVASVEGHVANLGGQLVGAEHGGGVLRLVQQPRDDPGELRWPHRAPHEPTRCAPLRSTRWPPQQQPGALRAHRQSCSPSWSSSSRISPSSPLIWLHLLLTSMVVVIPHLAVISTVLRLSSNTRDGSIWTSTSRGGSWALGRGSGDGESQPRRKKAGGGAPCGRPRRLPCGRRRRPPRRP